MRSQQTIFSKEIHSEVGRKNEINIESSGTYTMYKRAKETPNVMPDSQRNSYR